MNLNPATIPWNIFSEDDKKQAIESFDQWRVATRERFVEQGQYNPNKAFVRFFSEHFINFEWDHKYISAINEIAQSIKNENKIENKENFQTNFSIESFELFLQTTINVQKLQPIFEEINAKYKMLFTIKGVYRPDDAFVLAVVNCIPTLAEINALANMLNAREGIEKVDRLAAPYCYGDVQRIIGKTMVDQQRLQKTVDNFNVWRKQLGHIRKYFVSGYYNPNLAMLGFLKEKIQYGGDGLDNYAKFCVFAKMVKEQNKIENANRIKNPPCSYNEFDEVYRSMFVRSNVAAILINLMFNVTAILINLMFYVGVPLQILYFVYVAVKNFDKSLGVFSVKDITTSLTPSGQMNLLVQGQDAGPFKEMLRCMKESGCSQAALTHSINYDENPLASWSDPYFDKFLTPRNANITIYQSHQENNCSAATLFYCAEANRFAVTNLKKPQLPLFIANGETENCEEVDDEFNKMPSYRIK